MLYYIIEVLKVYGDIISPYYSSLNFQDSKHICTQYFSLEMCIRTCKLCLSKLTKVVKISPHQLKSAIVYIFTSMSAIAIAQSKVEILLLHVPEKSEEKSV